MNSPPIETPGTLEEARERLAAAEQLAACAAAIVETRRQHVQALSSPRLRVVGGTDLAGRAA